MFRVRHRPGADPRLAQRRPTGEGRPPHRGGGAARRRPRRSRVHIATRVMAFGGTERGLRLPHRHGPRGRLTVPLRGPRHPHPQGRGRGLAAVRTGGVSASYRKVPNAHPNRTSRPLRRAQGPPRALWLALVPHPSVLPRRPGPYQLAMVLFAPADVTRTPFAIRRTMCLAT